MLIWSGRGILIPLFALGGFLAGGVFINLFTKNNDTQLLASLWGGVFAVWVFALTLGKSSTQELVDPKTGQLHRITKSHTFFFMPGTVFAVFATLAAILITLNTFLEDEKDDRDLSSAAVSAGAASGQQVFDAANSKITSNRNGSYHGNTPEAQNLARAFSSIAKGLRDQAIDRGKSTVSLSGGEFLTYAHVTPTRCVFLVHVPELRKFSNDAKETMAEIAWISAQKVAADLNPAPETLAVGIRGALLYDRVLSGVLVNDPQNFRDGIHKEITGTSSKNLLAALFMPEAAPVAATPKAPPAPADDGAAGIGSSSEQPAVEESTPSGVPMNSPPPP